MDFIITGHPRSGTSMLIDYLNRQRKIYCYGEMVSKNNYVLHPKRFTDIESFIKSLKNEHPSQLTGMKFLYFDATDLKRVHNIDIFEKLHKVNPGVKFVSLTRKNEFLANFSMQRALHTNQWSCTKISPNKIIPFYFDLNKYYDAKVVSNGLNFLYEYVSKYYKFDTLNVTYEDLVSPQNKIIMEQIYTFIGGDPKEFRPQEITRDLALVKQNVFPIHSQLINYDEVYDKLRTDNDFLAAINQ